MSDDRKGIVPTADLAELRSLAEDIQIALENGNAVEAQDVEDLVDLFIELDDHVREGNSLPAQWRPKR